MLNSLQKGSSANRTCTCSFPLNPPGIHLRAHFFNNRYIAHGFNEMSLRLHSNIFIILLLHTIQSVYETVE